MDHMQSPDQLRKAIRELRIRADLAKKEGNDDDAKRIEHTIREYQDELSVRP